MGTVAGMSNPTQTGSPAILRYFEYKHLPEGLQVVSKQFHDLAEHMVGTLPPSAELSAGLRKLLEAKDCAVRAAL